MINGILNINKPEGITSAKVVAKIKKSFELGKVGHAGTLDPFATGVLLICINRATKAAQYLSGLDKEYIGTMILGVTTDTQDLDGKVLRIRKVSKKELDTYKIHKIFDSFKGIIYQRPPMFSAIKYKGSRLYNLAREGIKADVGLRKVKIHKLNIMKIKNGFYPSITFNVQCSKGTYIRTICHDIGDALGYGAFCSSLKRTKISNHTIVQSVDLDYFLKMPIEKMYQNIIPIDKALDHINKIILIKNKQLIVRVRNGCFFSENEIIKKIIKSRGMGLEDRFRVYTGYGKFIGIAKMSKIKNEKINNYKIEKLFYENNQL
jgi:tRNA pseudouridine55 synthase